MSNQKRNDVIITCVQHGVIDNRQKRCDYYMDVLLSVFISLCLCVLLGSFQDTIYMNGILSVIDEDRWFGDYSK